MANTPVQIQCAFPQLPAFPEAIFSIDKRLIFIKKYGSSTRVTFDWHLNDGRPLKDYQEGAAVGRGEINHYSSSKGWPEIGWGTTKGHSGRGYTTDFAKAIVAEYWRLPRGMQTREILPSALHSKKTENVKPCLRAVIETVNSSSRNVATKAGFVKHGPEFMEHAKRYQEFHLEDPS